MTLTDLTFKAEAPMVPVTPVDSFRDEKNSKLVNFGPSSFFSYLAKEAGTFSASIGFNK